MDRSILKEDIIKLCTMFSVSGFEYRSTEKIKELYGAYFDEIYADRVGNHILVKRCGRENVPKIMLDAHFDEIGLMVREVLEGGFLRVCGIGGIDPSIMQACDVTVYGKKELRGVSASIPPHLKTNKSDELPDISELLIDMGVGYTKEELEELVPIGTPVGFAPLYSEFGEGYIAGKSFDNKACGAIVARAVIDTPREELSGDVYLCFSAREEVGHPGGVYNATFALTPDYAMVIDVNLGNAPDAPERETVGMNKGASVAYSAATDRKLTRMTAELCKKNEIPFTPCAAPSSTGTNAVAVNLVEKGVPVVDIGLPLRNMHTYNEVISLGDCESLCELVKKFICSDELAKTFSEVSAL